MNKFLWYAYQRKIAGGVRYASVLPIYHETTLEQVSSAIGTEVYRLQKCSSKKEAELLCDFWNKGF